jgi:hypothetical protein
MRAVSPTRKNRIDFGVVTIVATAPAVAVTVVAADVLTPVAKANSVTLPARSPRVTVVAASPEPSVVVLAGENSTPGTLAEKLTGASGTPLPAASETFTTKAPTELLTVPALVGDVATLTVVGGPIFGPDESEHAAASTSHDAMQATSDGRIISSAR